MKRTIINFYKNITKNKANKIKKIITIKNLLKKIYHKNQINDD